MENKKIGKNCRCVYKLNLSQDGNDMIYIGSSVNFQNRYKNHKMKFTNLGIKITSFEILEVIDENDFHKYRGYLLFKETEQWIKYYRFGFKIYNPFPMKFATNTFFRSKK